MGLFSFLFGNKTIPNKERGTAVFQSPEKKIGSVGGITLTSSLVVKQFTEEETRENAKENRWSYEPAYRQVMGTVEADPKQISAMFNELLVAFTAGSPRREYGVVKQFLPDGTWRWPAYDAFVLPDAEAYYQECMDEIKTASLFDLLMWHKAPELRGLYTEMTADNPKLTSRKKADVSNALIAAITENQHLALVQRLRDKAIAELELPGTPDYKEMRELLCRRISSIAYETHRRSQRMELANRYPMWEFFVIANDSTPEECIKRKGKRFRYDDLIWDNVPCSNLRCGCTAHTVF
ncbi:MAG: hypothetical protein Q8O24_06270 [Gallionellaceae bacterium]|nr:hypothetical protein [Gallionellaceae bacterium]